MRIELNERVDEMSDEGAVNDEFVTGYRISKMLSEKGVERKPQQMYRYISQNLIPSHDVNGARLVSLKDANAFVAKFVAKHGKVSLAKASQ